jgi:hypothetical protein
VSGPSENHGLDIRHPTVPGGYWTVADTPISPHSPAGVLANASTIPTRAPTLAICKRL